MGPNFGLDGVSTVPTAQIETSAAKVDVVSFHLVEEDPPGFSVEVPGHLQVSGDALKTRDEDQRNRGSLLLPGDPRNLGPLQKSAVGPDPILVKPARDARAQRHHTAVIHEH